MTADPCISHITALLLDRDGTLIKDVHYLSKPSQVRLLSGVGESLGALSRRGMRFFLVSNQSGVGRGMFSEASVLAANARLAQLLEPFGVTFSDMVFCPHAPEAACDCRKPAPGMWKTLAARHALDPGECLMIGDKIEDMRFAANAGLGFRALVLTGKGAATAAGLGMPLPGKRFYRLTGDPVFPDHPHLILSSFRQLERGLELLTSRRLSACGV